MEGTVIGLMSLVGVAIALAGGPWGVRLLGVMLAVICAGLAWLFIRQKVVVVGGEVTVHNFWRTHRISIDSIRSIDVRLMPRDQVFAAHLNLQDGSGLFVSGLSLGKVQGATSWKRGAAEVRRLAEHVVSASVDSGSDESGSPVLIASSLAEDSSTPWYVWLVPVVGVVVMLGAIAAGAPIGGIAAGVGMGGGALMTSLSRKRP